MSFLRRSVKLREGQFDDIFKIDVMDDNNRRMLTIFVFMICACLFSFLCFFAMQKLFLGGFPNHHIAASYSEIEWEFILLGLVGSFMGFLLGTFLGRSWRKRASKTFRQFSKDLEAILASVAERQA